METNKWGDKRVVGSNTSYWNGLTWLPESEWLRFHTLAQEAINAYFDGDEERAERMHKYSHQLELV